MKQKYRFITLLWPLLFSLLFAAPNLVAQSDTPASPLSLETLESELKQFERQDLKQTEFEELNGLWHDLASYEFNEALPASRLREQVTWRARLLIRAAAHTSES